MQPSSQLPLCVLQPAIFTACSTHWQQTSVGQLHHQPCDSLHNSPHGLIPHLKPEPLELTLPPQSCTSVLPFHSAAWNKQVSLTSKNSFPSHFIWKMMPFLRLHPRVQQSQCENERPHPQSSTLQLSDPMFCHHLYCSCSTARKRMVAESLFCLPRCHSFLDSLKPAWETYFTSLTLYLDQHNHQLLKRAFTGYDWTTEVYWPTHTFFLLLEVTGPLQWQAPHVLTMLCMFTWRLTLQGRHGLSSPLIHCTPPELQLQPPIRLSLRHSKGKVQAIFLDIFFLSFLPSLLSNGSPSLASNNTLGFPNI